MLKLLLSPKAINDLEEIFDYTLYKWNIKQAEKYQDDLFGVFQEIIINPRIGSIYYFRIGNYRTIKKNRHLIFYKTEHQNCIIARILHERMDLDFYLTID